MALILIPVGFAGCRGCSELEESPLVSRPPRFTISKETTFITEPIDDAGYPDYAAAFNRIYSKGVTPENNANVLLWKAMGPHPLGVTMDPKFFEWLGIKEPPVEGDYYVPLANHVWLKDDADAETYLKKWCKGPWTKQQNQQLAEWLERNEQPLSIVIEATKRARYFSPLVPPTERQSSLGIISTLLPGAQLCKEIIQALIVRAMLNLGEGCVDAAWTDLIAARRLSRLLPSGGCLLEGLLGLRADIDASNACLLFLAHARLSPRQIKTCQRELRTLPPMAPIVDLFDVGDRFMVLDSITLLNRYGIKYGNNMTGGEHSQELDPWFEFLDKNVDWNPALRKTNQWFDRITAAMRLQNRLAREEQFRRISSDLLATKEACSTFEGLAQSLGQHNKIDIAVISEKLGDIMITLLLPSAAEGRNDTDRHRQVQSNIAIAFALAAHKADSGTYPLKLQDLVPTYAKEIPNDLFSDEPLIYRPSEDGYLLYSVGVNETDDGGRTADDVTDADDIVIRMPLPKLPRN